MKRFSADDLRKASRARVARLFHRDIDSIDVKLEFGEELKSTFDSDFHANEYEQLHRDIRDVSNKDTLHEIESGRLLIRTVGDYCEHMVRCYEMKPQDVIRVLSLTQD